MQQRFSPLQDENFVFLPPKLQQMKSWKWIVFSLSLLVVTACQKPVEYPVEPHIAFEGFTYLFDADSTFSGEGIVSFSYTDGDGDLGLDDGDTLPPFGRNDAHYYNMVVDYLKSVNGEFVKTPLLSWNAQTQSYDTVTFNARFRRLRDSEDPKAISGTMEYKLTVQNPFSPNDTVKFEIRILDRALHESNTIQTDPIFTNPIFHSQQFGLPRFARNDRHCEEERRSNP